MGVKRIGNPRFHLGVNKLGRKSHMLNPAAANVNAAGLRAGLDVGPPQSALPRQRGANEVLEDAGLLPVEWEQQPNRRAYLREAREMVDRYPHWGGQVAPSDSKVELTTVIGEEYTAHSVVRRDGVAEVSWETHDTQTGHKVTGTHFLYPGANLSETTVTFPLEVPGVNARGANLSGFTIAHGSIFDGADLRNAKMSNSSIVGSLRNANLNDADLTGAQLHHADVDGASFTGAKLDFAHMPLDLTKTNITREQFDSLAGMGEWDSGRPYRVREASVEEVVAAYGGDRDAVTAAVWSGDVEVRERATSKVVTGGFDPDVHYIPAWALPSSYVGVPIDKLGG